MRKYQDLKNLLKFFGKNTPIIPLPMDSKGNPFVKWKGMVTDGVRLVGEEFDAVLNGRNFNPGLLTGHPCGYVVVDADNEEGVSWVTRELPDTPLQVARIKNRRHFFFRIRPGAIIGNKADILRQKARLRYEAKKQLDLDLMPKNHGLHAQEIAEAARDLALEKLGIGPMIDIRGTGGYVVAAGAIHPKSGAEYRTKYPLSEINVNDIPYYDEAWFTSHIWAHPESLPDSINEQDLVHSLSDDKRIKKAIKWLEKQEPSVTGRGGDDRTWRVALGIVRGHDLSAHSATDLIMKYYNHRCQPPWSLSEIQNKTLRAERDSPIGRGYLLKTRPGPKSQEYQDYLRLVEPPPVQSGVSESEEDDTLDVDGDESSENTPKIDDALMAVSETAVRDLTKIGITGSSPDHPVHRLEDKEREFIKYMWNRRGGVDLNDIGDERWIFTKTKTTTFLPMTQNNLMTTLANGKLRDSLELKFDVLKREILINGEVATQVDVENIRSALESYWGKSVGKREAEAALYGVASRKSFNPIKDLLNSFPAWDGIDRYSELLRAMHVEESEINYEIIKKFMISLVARGMNPGIKVDTMLILHSRDQGLKKSSFFRLLANDTIDHVDHGLFSDTEINLHNRDSWSMIVRYWIIEWSETDHLKNRKEANNVKAFITQQSHVFRAAYDTVPREWPRPCVFGGTSNDQELLNDPTGGRRMMILTVDGDIEEGDIKALRPMVFAQSLALFNAHMSARGNGVGNAEWENGRWWFTRPEQAKIYDSFEKYVDAPVLSEALGEILENFRDGITLGQAASALGITPDRQSRKTNGDIKDALRHLGYDNPGQKTTRVNGRVGKYWTRADRHGMRVVSEN